MKKPYTQEYVVDKADGLPRSPLWQLSHQNRTHQNKKRSHQFLRKSDMEESSSRYVKDSQKVPSATKRDHIFISSFVKVALNNLTWTRQTFQTAASTLFPGNTRRPMLKLAHEEGLLDANALENNFISLKPPKKVLLGAIGMALLYQQVNEVFRTGLKPL